MRKKPNGTNSVYKTANGKWVGQIVIGKYDNGNLKYKRFTASKQSDVVTRMKEYQQNSDNAISGKSCSLGEYMLGYLTTVKKNTLKPSSFDRDNNTYSVIKRYIGQYALTELFAAVIQEELINKLKNDNYSYSTIHKAFVLLNECLNYAVEKNQLGNNPCSSVKQPVKKDFDFKKIRYLTEEEIESFIKAATTRKPNGQLYYKYGLLMCLDIYTGLRCGELAALQWKDINFKDKYLTVKKSVTTTYEYDSDGKRTGRNVDCIDTAKAADVGRIVNLNQKSLRFLNELKTECGEDYNPDFYISTNSTETKSVDVISGSYTGIAKSANIETPLGIHTLRNTFASLLIKKGIDIKVVSEQLGHKDVAFTYNTYIQLINEQKAKAIETLDDI